MPITRFTLIAMAAAALAVAAPGNAQEAPATEVPAVEAPAPEAAATETPAADAPAAADLAPEAPAAGAPAAETAPAATSPVQAGGTPATGAAPAAGAPATGDPAAAEVLEVVKETHGDWEVRCAPDETSCFLYQLALDDAKNPVAEFSLLKLPEGSEAAAGVTVVTPLGTLLTSGLVVQIDSGEKRQYPFAWCSQVGCFSRFGVDAESLASLKRGKAGKVTLVSVGAPDKPVELSLSLNGFTAAFDALTVPSAVPN